MAAANAAEKPVGKGLKRVLSHPKEIIGVYLCFILLGVVLGYVLAFAEQQESVSLVISYFFPVLTSVGVVILIFQALTHVEWKKRKLSQGLSSFMVFLILMMLFATWAIVALFSIDNLLLAFSMVFILSASSPQILFSLFRKLHPSKVKALEFLEHESLFTPIIVVLGISLMELLLKLEQIPAVPDASVANMAWMTAQHFLAGIGTGVVVGIILFWLMKRHAANIWTDIGLIGGAFLTYAVAIALSGSGAIAVATLGFLFVNSHARREVKFISFSPFFLFLTKLFRGIVLKALGVMLSVFLAYVVAGFSWNVILELAGKTIGLMLLISVLRFLSLSLGTSFSVKERAFMSLVLPKGSLAAAGLLFVSLELYYSDQMLMFSAILLYILSLALSYVMVHHKDWFLRESGNGE